MWFPCTGLIFRVICTLVYDQDNVRKPRNSKLSHCVEACNTQAVTQITVALTVQRTAFSPTTNSANRIIPAYHLPQSQSSPMLSGAWGKRNLEHAVPPVNEQRYQCEYPHFTAFQTTQSVKLAKLQPSEPCGFGDNGTTWKQYCCLYFFPIKSTILFLVTFINHSTHADTMLVWSYRVLSEMDRPHRVSRFGACLVRLGLDVMENVELPTGY